MYLYIETKNCYFCSFIILTIQSFANSCGIWPWMYSLKNRVLKSDPGSKLLIPNSLFPYSSRILIHIGSCIHILDPVFRSPILYSDLRSCIQILDPVFRYWILYSDIGSCIQILDPVFRYWILYSYIGFCIQILDPVFIY